MYRRTIPGQYKLEIPFGVELSTENRWVQTARIIPWEKIEELYSAKFEGINGQVTKPSRLAFAALYIQRYLKITDNETVNQIRENPSMQYFCGFESYTTEKPFDSSLMVHFRKRISASMMKEITKEAFAAEARKAIEKEHDDDADDDEDSESGSSDSGDDAGEKNKGTMLLDATCCPSDIHYPTDIRLLNHARELTEQIIDELHKQLLLQGFEKPRTYRKVARKEYLGFAKRRKYTQPQLRTAIRQQLQYIRRNLDSITTQTENGASIDDIRGDFQKKLQTIKELYRQQKQMFDNRTHKVDDRIVSIAQPYIRPIVRGKPAAPAEFGAKVATARIGGFTFVIHLDYENFSEAKYLEDSAEEYKRIFGFYPAAIIGDKLYGTRDNRNYCNSKKIRLSGPKLGRKTDEIKEAERERNYRDSCKRNAIEGDYGTGKRRYGLDRIMAKLDDTTFTSISFGFFVKNTERMRVAQPV